MTMFYAGLGVVIVGLGLAVVFLALAMVRMQADHAKQIKAFTDRVDSVRQWHGTNSVEARVVDGVMAMNRELAEKIMTFTQEGRDIQKLKIEHDAVAEHLTNELSARMRELGRLGVRAEPPPAKPEHNGQFDPPTVRAFGGSPD